MAKIQALGGVFFKTADPDSLAAWYQQHLGLGVAEDYCGANFSPSQYPQGGFTLWSLFPKDSTYFAEDFIVNFIVDDVAGALVQVELGGATDIKGPVLDPCGSFGWFTDPAGHRVELWQPPTDN